MKHILVLIVCLLFPFLNNVIVDNILIFGLGNKNGTSHWSTSTTFVRSIASINDPIVAVCSLNALQSDNF